MSAPILGIDTNKINNIATPVYHPFAFPAVRVWSQNYVDRTTDIQTAALVAARSAAFFPSRWTKETEIAQVWATGYRQRLMDWQFWFNV